MNTFTVTSAYIYQQILKQMTLASNEHTHSDFNFHISTYSERMSLESNEHAYKTKTAKSRLTPASEQTVQVAVLYWCLKTPYLALIYTRAQLFKANDIVS